MRKMELAKVIMIGAIIIAFTAFISCGEDEEDGEASTVGQMTGVVQEFSNKQPVGGAEVEVINNLTGESFNPQLIEISDSYGVVSFDIPGNEDKVGIKISKSGYKDTYQYNILRTAQEETLYIVHTVTAAGIAGTLGLDLDVNRGIVAGAVYWGSPDYNTPIGCAIVLPDPTGGEIRYAGAGGKPVRTEEGAAEKSAETGEEIEGRDNTHPDNGRFFIINLPVGESIKITSNADGKEEYEILPKVVADSINIRSIYYNKTDYQTDPTPEGCE